MENPLRGRSILIDILKSACFRSVKTTSDLSLENFEIRQTQVLFNLPLRAVDDT